MKNLLLVLCLIPSLGFGQFLKIEHPQTVYDVSFSENGDLLASAGKDSVVRIWSLEGKKVWESNKLDHSISKVLWLEGLNLWLASSYGGHVYIIKERGGIFRDKKSHEDAVTSIGFIPKRNLILMGCRGGILKVLEMGLNPIWEKEIAEKQVHVVKFNRNRDIIITGDSEGDIENWDFEGNRVGGYEFGEPDVWNFALMDDPQFILARTRTGNTQVFNAMGKPISRFGKDGGMGALIYNNGLVVNSGSDGMIRYWNIAGQKLDSFQAHDSYISGLAYSSRGYLASCGGDKSVRLWKWKENLENDCPYFDLFQGEWSVHAKDRISPGVYEENKGISTIRINEEDCELMEVYKGKKGGKDWEVSINTKQSEKEITRVWQDSEHGNSMELKGGIEGDALFAAWTRDPADKKMQVQHELRFTGIREFELKTKLSTDYGKTWTPTHEWKYKRKN